MAGNSKLIVAIVLSVVGVLLGILGTVTAYNAKDAVDSDANTTSEIQTLVQDKFDEAQTKQDQLEASQKSEAEQFVAQLTKGKRNLLQKINNNSKSIKRLQRSNRKLRNQVKTLNDRDRQMSSEVDQIENDQAAEFSQLNQRVNRTNQRVQQLQNQVNRLRGLVGG